MGHKVPTARPAVTHARTLHVELIRCYSCCLSSGTGGCRTDCSHCWVEVFDSAAQLCCTAGWRGLGGSVSHKHLLLPKLLREDVLCDRKLSFSLFPFSMFHHTSHSAHGSFEHPSCSGLVPPCPGLLEQRPAVLQRCSCPRHLCPTAPAVCS